MCARTWREVHFSSCLRLATVFNQSIIKPRHYTPQKICAHTYYLYIYRSLHFLTYLFTYSALIIESLIPWQVGEDSIFRNFFAKLRVQPVTEHVLCLYQQLFLLRLDLGLSKNLFINMLHPYDMND